MRKVYENLSRKNIQITVITVFKIITHQIICQQRDKFKMKADNRIVRLYISDKK